MLLAAGKFLMTRELNENVSRKRALHQFARETHSRVYRLSRSEIPRVEKIKQEKLVTSLELVSFTRYGLVDSN